MKRGFLNVPRQNDNMKIMTQEYCERCPWFNHSLGYLEDSDYWESHKSGCACQDCTYRQECEATGPKDLLTCLVLGLDERRAKVLEKHPEILEKLKRSEAER